MTPDRLHSDTVAHVANKVSVEGGKPPSILTSTFRNIALLAHFLRQRFQSLFGWNLLLMCSVEHTWASASAQFLCSRRELGYPKNFVSRCTNLLCRGTHAVRSSRAMVNKIGPCIIAGCSSHLCVLPLNEGSNLLQKILKLAFGHGDYIYVVF